jgi:hypothetical protein
MTTCIYRLWEYGLGDAVTFQVWDPTWPTAGELKSSEPMDCRLLQAFHKPWRDSQALVKHGQLIYNREAAAAAVKQPTGAEVHSKTHMSAHMQDIRFGVLT